ncbi:MAG: multicopper oxidase domain-containing protein [Gammaproteobacteria bacterium]|nr:multicopper oxidase domain-containing protein [Gammaproteobacteria bacterium]
MDRRHFLKAGMSAAAYISLPGITALLPQRAEAATLSFNLQAAMLDFVPLGMNPPITIPMWQFVDVTNPALPFATQLRVNAGDTISINLVNNLPVPINISVPGVLSNAPLCLPGGAMTYSFTAPLNPGSYPFYDESNGLLGRAMGLAGGLVVLPADGSMTMGGVAYSRDHTLLFAEVDTRLNDAVAAGLVFDMANYAPNYFFVNGLCYVRDIQHVELQMALGENVAFRMINAGLIFYPMHFHGYHVSVYSRNAVPELLVRDKDSVLIKPDEAVEALLMVNQAGLYPLHTHYLPGVTNNGSYAGGGLIVMNAA